MWIQITCLLAFHIPWDCSNLTLHFPSGVLYKEPLIYIEEEELKSKRTIVHCCHSLLVLESTSLCPLEHFVFFPIFHFLVSLLSRDGGLRWWRPRWRTQFLRFVDVLTEVVTIVISNFVNRNIFSCPIMCNWIWILNPWMCLIVYALLNIYARVGRTHYCRACLSCCCCWERIAKESMNWKSSTGIYFNHMKQGTIWYPLVLDVWFLLHIWERFIYGV